MPPVTATLKFVVAPAQIVAVPLKTAAVGGAQVKLKNAVVST